MAVAMAGFTMNDAITKAVSSEMNFGEMMLVRGRGRDCADRSACRASAARCVRCAR